MMNVRDQIRRHLFETLVPTPREQWPADDADLFQAGLDSLRFMQLLVFIEQEIGVRLPDDELTADRVNSVQALVGWVESHRQT